MQLEFQPLGDNGIRIGFPQKISPEVNQAIRAFAFALEKKQLDGIMEWVPTYAALSVYYDPKTIRYHQLVEVLQALQAELADIALPPARLIQIPVLYGGEVGPDLAHVAQYHDSSEAEVISLHTSRPYLVYMLGFTPGFPYLGGMPEELATPRLNNPRSKIRGGSVGIGGSQTGIYSIDAPGGWQIIGHTPVPLYQAHHDEPVLLRAGDYVQFRAIKPEEYQQIQEQVSQGTYQPEIRAMKEDA